MAGEAGCLLPFSRIPDLILAPSGKLAGKWEMTKPFRAPGTDLEEDSGRAAKNTEPLPNSHRCCLNGKRTCPPVPMFPLLTTT